MAFRYVMRQRHALPFAIGAFSAGVGSSLYPRPAYAEAPTSETKHIKTPRKPIYDDPIPPSNSSSQKHTADSTVDSEQAAHDNPENTTPSLTDQIAVQVRHTRLFLHDVSESAETSFNNFMTRAFNLEDNFTTTIRSLAPPPEADEPLLAGLAYTFVAALAGTIITRRRGIILRATVPLTLGLAMGYTVLPATMRNVEGLIQDWEGKYSPELRERHIKAKERIESFVTTGIEHTKMALSQGEEVVSDARKGVEDWVRKGK